MEERRDVEERRDERRCLDCAHPIGAHPVAVGAEPACTVPSCRCSGFDCELGLEALCPEAADEVDDVTQEEPVTWSRLDDGMADHPKYEKFGALRLAALGLQTAALCHCAKYLTDGVISRERVEVIGAALEPGVLEKLIAGMLEYGIWQHHDDGGFVVHDYLEYNPSRKAVLHEREKDRRRKEQGRKAQRRQLVVEQARPGGLRPESEQSLGVPARPVPSRSKEASKTGTRRPRLPALPPVSPDGEPPPESAWSGYSRAFEARYKAAPLSNAKIRGQLAQFERRVPRSDAAAVARHYVQSEERLYVQSRHCVDLLLRDSEKLWSEWKTGTRTPARAEKAPIELDL
jgi:hypothetical protein